MPKKESMFRMFQNEHKGRAARENYDSIAIFSKMKRDQRFEELIRNLCIRGEELGHRYLPVIEPLEIVKNICEIDEFNRIFSGISDPLQMESTALDYLVDERREDFKQIFLHSTMALDIEDMVAERFVLRLLNLMKGKSLYSRRFRMIDIGTGSGKFTKKIVSYIDENFENADIIRTNVVKIPIMFHPSKSVSIHNIIKGPVGKKSDLIIIKDLMKFYNEETRSKIWMNVLKDCKKGAIVLSGGTSIYGSKKFKLHVKVDNKLIKVDPTKFLYRLVRVKNRTDYLQNLEEIIG